MRDPETGEDHQKVEKIFDLCTPYWDNRWTFREANVVKIQRWVRDFMPKMKTLRFTPPRRRAMRMLACPPSSGAGPDRRPFGFWKVTRRWLAGIFVAAVGKMATGKWSDPDIPEAQAQNSLPGGRRLPPEQANILIQLTLKLMYLIP